jgi:hypothetical protein
MVNVIALYGNSCREQSFDFVELNKRPWVKYILTAGFEIYYVLLEDSPEYNTIAKNLLNLDVRGTLLFVKISKTSVANIEMIDIPDLIEYTLSANLSELNMAIDDYIEDKYMDCIENQENCIDTGECADDDADDYAGVEYADQEYYEFHGRYDSN